MVLLSGKLNAKIAQGIETAEECTAHEAEGSKIWYYMLTREEFLQETGICESLDPPALNVKARFFNSRIGLWTLLSAQCVKKVINAHKGSKTDLKWRKWSMD